MTELNPIGTIKGLPVFIGKAASAELFKRYGLANSVPTVNEEGKPHIFGKTGLSLYVDDDDGGRPVAYHTTKSERLTLILGPVLQVKPRASEGHTYPKP